MQRIAFLLRLPTALLILVAVGLSFIGMAVEGRSLPGMMAEIVSPATHNDVSSGLAIPPPRHSPTQRPHQTVDCAKQACIALTFDDGPNPITTPQILDVLDRHHARGSFFLVGSRVAGQEALVRRMFYGGHEIGNHSWNHPDFTKLSPEQIATQIEQTQAAIMQAGVPAPSLFRPPYGAADARVRAQVPMTFAFWNVDPLDWRSRDPSHAAHSMLAQARPGAVFDLHDIYANTAQSLDQVIIELQKHYELVTFSELMNLQPGQPGDYYGR